MDERNETVGSLHFPVVVLVDGLKHVIQRINPAALDTGDSTDYLARRSNVHTSGGFP